MAVTRIKNNQVTDSSSGNTQVGINAGTKLQDFSITAGKIANNLTYGSDLTVTGNLTVQGNSTAIDTTITTIEDPIIVLASTQTSGAPAVDIGFLGFRGNESNIAFVWDESADSFVTAFTSTGESNTTITITSYANLQIGNLSLTGNILNSTLNVTGNITGGNLLTPGLISATGAITSAANITGGNILTGGLISATSTITSAANITGGNILTAGLISATSTITSAANITGGNLLTAGLISATSTITSAANITGGNLLTGGLISATSTITSAANITGGNVLTGGVVSATANITGGNLLTGGLISATSTITSAANIAGGNLLTGGLISATSTITTTANITGGNILFGSGQVSGTGNVYATNFIGNISGNIDAAGANTQIQFNDDNLLGASAAFTFNKASNALVNSGNITGGNLLTAGLISATSTITSAANIAGGNITTGGLITATGNITGGNVLTGGLISATSTITSAANVTGGNLLTGGAVTATGNITGGNILTAGLVSATGTITSAANIAGGNLLTGGLISATSTITSAANITGGNILTAGLISATSTITSAANVTGGNITTAGVVTATGNITGGNLLTPGLISAAGLATSGNVQTAGFVSAAGNVIALAVNTATLASSAGITITTIGANGNINLTPNGTGNIVLGGNTYVNGVNLTPVQDNDVASKYYVDTIATTGITIHEAVFAATNTTLATATGGTVTYNQPNGAANGVGATLTTTGSFNLIDTANVQTVGTRILVKDQANAVQNGVYVYSNTTVITRSTDTDQYGADSAESFSINDYFFTTGGNVNAGTAFVVSAPAGVITFGTSNISFGIFSQSQVYTANTAAGLVLNGTVFSAKVDNNTTAFDNDGNIIVKAGANLTTPNIGAATGTSLSATGNIQGGNILTGGFVTATGNVTGGNVTTAGLITVTGNVTGGNILTAGLISATSTITSAANITGGNLLTGGLISATSTITSAANISGGNVLTGGLVSATANVTGGNLLTGGLISATSTITSAANISGGNIRTAGLISATGNVTGGNVTTAGLITATGNITGGNILTAGLISATGTITSAANITGGNLLTGGVVSATANITGGNILSGGLGSFTGNVTAANFIGNISGNIDAGGANTNIQFNDSDILNGSAGFTFNKVGNVVTANGNITGANLFTGGTVSATANITGGNVLTAGLISATGNATLGNVGTNQLSLSGNVISALNVTGNITGGNLLTAGLISTSGNVYAENILNTAGNTQISMGNGSGIIGITSTANTTQFLPGGQISLGGAARVQGGTFAGSYLTLGASQTDLAQDRGGNVTVQLGTGGTIANTWTFAQSGAFLAPGAISATGNITGANLILTTGLIDGPAAGRITINGSDIDTDFAVDGDTLANVFYVDAGTGTASFGASTQITNAIVNFATTTSIKTPVGNTAQRPGTGVTGMLRFNTTSNALEVYDNSAWASVGTPVFTVIADEQFAGDGATVAFTLGSTQTTNSCIVSINGVVQIPTLAYAVAGTDPTCVLTFTEAPASGDVIDVREITTTTTVTSITNSSGNAVVSVSDTAAQVNVTGDLSVSGTILGGNINSTAITSGTSNMSIVSSGGNIRGNVAGTTVMTISPGLVDIVGNLTVSGNATLSGNILGDRIQNGNTSFDIQTPNGNANINIGGTGNLAVFAPGNLLMTGNITPTANITYDLGTNTNRWKDIWLANSTIYLGNSQISANATALIFTNPAGGQTVLAGATAGITGATVSASGNITGGNILTAGLISATGAITGAALTGTSLTVSTGNITGGNLLLSGAIIDSAQLDIQTSAGSANIALAPNGTGMVTVSTQVSAVGNVTGGNIRTAGLISATGAITGAALTGTSLTVSTGNVSCGNIVNTNANGVGNIGSTGTRFNQVFALASSAQYADLAEKYTADAEYAPGTVVVFGGTAEVTVNTIDSDRRVAGVVSTNPAYIMNDALESAHVVTVALTGRVPTSVTGTVRKGDLMVSAGNGKARAEANPAVGTVIGKALEDSEGDAVIEVVVGRV